MENQPKLVSIAIVAVGDEMPQNIVVEGFIELKHKELGDGIVLIDIREHMPHATSGYTVTAGQDGTWPQTAIAVYAHPKFAPLVNSIVSFVAGHHEGEPTIVVLRCTTGYHRADVASRTVKDVLNSLMCIDRASGELCRVINANTFSLAAAETLADASSRWARVCSWHVLPWTIAPTPPVDQRFAYLHHTATEETTITFNTIWEHAEAVLSEQKKSVSIAFGTVESSPVVVYPIKPLPKRRRVSASSASGSAGVTPIIRALVPTPPSEPPRDWGEVCMCCSGRGMVDSRLAAWVTHSDDVRVWANVLDELGADPKSQKELFNLATSGPEYRTAAGSIIHKVLKKSDYGEIGNVSAFIASSVKMAWHGR